MSTFGKTLKWLLFLVLLGGGAGGGYGWYLWQHTDEILHARVLGKLRELAPACDIQIGRARFDLQGRIRIFDLKVKPPGAAATLLDVPEVIITADCERMADNRLEIHQIRLLRPHVGLARNTDGLWNWHDIHPPSPMGALPEWIIEQAQVTVLVQSPGRSTPTSMVLRNIDGQLTPSGKRQFKIKVTTKVDLADSSALSGEWNLNDQSWLLSGELGGLKIGGALADLLSGFLPEAAGAFARAVQQSTRPLTAGHEDDPRALSEAAAPEPSLNATVDMRFRLARWQADAELEYNAALTILQGEVIHPLLPFVLRDLRGDVVVDNRKLTLRGVSARNGLTVTTANGEIAHQNELCPTRLNVDVQSLDLNDRLRACLPEAHQKIYDSLQPSGKVDLKLRLKYNDRDGWDQEADLVAKGCTAAHAKFPLEVDQIDGTVTQQGDVLQIAMRGVTGERPVILRGRIKNPGPEAEALFDIDVVALPLDARLRAACPPPVQLTLDALRIQGLIDTHLRITRPAGPNQKFIPTLVARLRDCSTNCRCFPYPISGVSGIVEGVGNDSWTFRDMRGRHEDAQILGSGTFRRDAEGRSRLLLDLQVAGATFDPQLQAAIPEQWQAVWKEFVPTGRLNAGAHVDWTPGLPPAVLLNAQLLDAGLCMKSFPYALDDVQARIDLGDGRLTIRSLTGRHDDTRVRMTGLGTFAPGGEWRIRLNDLFVDDLDPDRRFRKTLPPRLREVIETLDPRGKLSLSGTLEFAGTGRPSDAVTAAWNLLTVYSGATLTTGIDLDNLHGRVTLNGTWDGNKVVGNGQIDLDSVSIKGHQLTEVKGPVHVDGTHLVIGSIDEVNRSGAAPGQPAGNARRVTANFINGILALDGAAVLEKETSYHVRMELTGGRLERYAQLYMKKRYKLMGIINGWVDFDGRGASAQRLKGRGQVVVSPAALYELPVVVAIFKILNFAPPDKTAFRQALVVFDIGGGQLQIRRAELNGDAITLRGRGYIPFEGPMNLDFYSSAGRSQLPIPIVGPLIGGATEGWVGVQVRGTMSDPVATVRALPQMDDALRNFLGLFDARNPGANQRGTRQDRNPRR